MGEEPMHIGKLYVGLKSDDDAAWKREGDLRKEAGIALLNVAKYLK